MRKKRKPPEVKLIRHGRARRSTPLMRAWIRRRQGATAIPDSELFLPMSFATQAFIVMIVTAVLIYDVIKASFRLPEAVTETH